VPLEGPPDRCQASSHPHRQSKESLVGETAVKALIGVLAKLVAILRPARRAKPAAAPAEAPPMLSKVTRRLSSGVTDEQHEKAWIGTGADHDREEDTLLEEVSTHFVQAAHSVSMRLGSHKEHAE